MRGQGGECDGGVDFAVGGERFIAQPVKTETAAAVPVRRFGDAALFAGDDRIQTRHAVGDGMRAHLDANPPSSHLMRHRGRGAGAEERIQHPVAFGGGELQDALNESLRFGGGKNGVGVKRFDFLFGVLIVADFCV